MRNALILSKHRKGKLWVTIGRKATYPDEEVRKEGLSKWLYCMWFFTNTGPPFWRAFFIDNEGKKRGGCHMRVLSEQAKVDTEQTSGKKTVLVVEDVDAVRGFLVEALSYGGYRVIAANDGMDGLEKFHSNAESIDLLLLDVVMPKLNGVGLFEQIRSEHPEVRVLFMSGYNEILDQIRWEEHIRYIPKPFGVDAILKEVKLALAS